MSIHKTISVVQQLWRDTRGNMAPVDLILMTAITAIGVMVGLVIVRDGVVQEMGDVAVALDNLDQSFSASISLAERASSRQTCSTAAVVSARRRASSTTFRPRSAMARA